MQEFHLIPQDGKEHQRNAECWCKPEKKDDATSVTWTHNIFRPVIEESVNIDEIMAFFEKATGETAHKEMAKLSIGTVCRVMVAKELGEIIGMKAYASVVNPFIGKMGYALLVDLGNGYGLELPA